MHLVNNIMSGANLVVQYDDKNQSYYCRESSNESDNLCQSMINLYPCADSQILATVCPSGMSAINTVFNALLKNNQNANVNIIYGDELYCDIPILICWLSEIYKFTTYRFNVSDDISQLFTSNNITDDVNILYVESATNPSGDIFDFDSISMLRKLCKKLYVVVDNTWLTHIILNPFVYDVDIVVLSLTKYYSGSKCIAGCILCKPTNYFGIIDYVGFTGLHTSPLYCDTISKSILTMNDRIIKISDMACNIASKMIQSGKFIVRHSSLVNDLSHCKAVKYYNCVDGVKLHPGIIKFEVYKSLDETLEWINNMKYIQPATSYGASVSRIDPEPVDSSCENIIKSMCRLAIGYDDTVDNIWYDLNK